MRVPRDKIAEARERIDLTANVYWGLHTTSPPGQGPNDPDEVLERVICDFALVSKTPIDVIKKRAQTRLKEKYATEG